MVAWQYLDDTGNVLGESVGFADRTEAEAWMAESWEDLRDRGVDEVALMEPGSDQPLYRMGLSPADD
jgi:hypothetical protein